MGDHHLQLLLLSHSVNTILNHLGNQILCASYEVFVDVATVLRKSMYFITGFFPSIFKFATIIKNPMYFVICSTNTMEIFSSFGSICHLVKELSIYIYKLTSLVLILYAGHSMSHSFIIFHRRLSCCYENLFRPVHKKVIKIKK